MAETLTVQLDKILDSYSAEVSRVTSKAIDEVSKASVKKLKNESPQKTGSYARGWRAKKQRVAGDIATVTVHNATDYQLTHLLENGHLIVNGKGTYGRTKPIKHIEPVEEWANSELVEIIERELR